MQRTGRYYDNFDPAELEYAIKTGKRFTKFSGDITHIPYIFYSYSGGKTSGLITYGQTMLITGAKKSKKSYFAYMFAMAMLATNGPNGAPRPSKYENLHCHAQPGDHIFVFDTELAATDFEPRMQKILLKAGYETAPDNFHAYPLKEFVDPVVKFLFIIKYIEEYKSSIGLIIIDKIMDLLGDTSNRQHINQCYTKLGSLQQKYGFAMIWTMHQNRRDESANGLPGVEAEKEVSYAFKAKDLNPGVENSLSLIETEYIRNRDSANAFKIGISNTGFPYVADYGSATVIGQQDGYW